MTTREILQKTKAAWGCIRSAGAEEKNRLLLSMAVPAFAAQAPLAPEAAVTVLYKDEIFASDNIQQATKQKAAAYKAEQCSAVAAVANGAADAAVKAADVRAAAAQALDMLASKRAVRLAKKHGNITL